MADPVIPDVEFSADPVVEVNHATIERIRQAAHASPKKRARLCLHRGPAERLHNMLIVLLKGTIVPIHRHPQKAECYHVVSGLISILLHDASGRETQRIPLGSLDTGRSSLCRIDAGIWHTVLVESNEVVMHESTIGPFTPTDTEILAGPST